MVVHEDAVMAAPKHRPRGHVWLPDLMPLDEEPPPPALNLEPEMVPRRRWHGLTLRPGSPWQ